MATVKQTKSFTGSTGNNDEWAWKEEVIEKFNDDYITTNKSIITVNTYLTRVRSASNFGGTASCNIKCKNSSSVEIFNHTVNKTFSWPAYVGVNNWILIQSETFEMQHNADGSQKITVESTLSTDDFSPNWTYAYGEMQLTTIPRTSKVTCPSFNIGDSTVINIERASNTFTHTLKYVFGTANGPIVAKTTSTSVGWTPNVDIFHRQMPNAVSRKGKVICETYSGNTLIGTSECEFTAYVTQANPDVSATIVDTNNTTIALTGDSSKLIRYFSKPQVTISATAKKKASISSYKTTIADGQSSTSQETTFPKIDANGIIVYATDSRGWIGSKTYNPTFINYIKLAFTSIDIDRTESTSTTVKAVLKGNYYNASFGSVANTLTMKWRYKLSSSATWNSWIAVTPTISGNTFSFNANLGNGFDNNSDYDIEFVVSDKLMTNISTGIVRVTKGTGVLDIYKDKIQSNVNLILKSGIILDNIIPTIPVCGKNGLSNDISGKDLDTIVDSGFYYGNNIINGPSGNKYGYLLVISHIVSKNYCVQFFYPTNGGYFYIRCKKPDWESWGTIAVSRN